MRHLKINLENCYGIKKFEKELDFSTAKVVAIYAPNGSMKSSLAQVFLDIANNVNSKDRFFPSRPCTRVVKDENDVDLPKECVLVVKPYDENMNLTPISTLLVNSTLSKEYEDLHVEIKSAKNSFLKALKTQSETNKDVEKEVSTTFTDSDNKFFDALNCIKDEIATQSDTTLSTIPYDVVFDEKVISFLAASNYKAVIESYIKKYNELLASSTYFKKGTFNYYNATTIARELGKNGFFAANHSINLNADQKLEITTQQELEDLIIKEKETISNDQDLKKKFTEIEKLLKKNTVMRDFENYLQNHEELLTKLADIPAFKKEVWKSYIKIKSDLYQSLLDKYQTTAARRKEIQQQAAEERTQWEAVIDIFNKRFSVPFTLKLVNQEAVILDQPEVA
ncbi:MAG: hypothetical protein IT497_01515 [Ottowia sp.]|nr:hypothetical protein [Ottowia sp.]